MGSETTTSLFWHYLVNIFIYTGIIVALMYAATHYLKRNPDKLNPLRQSQSGNRHTRTNPLFALLQKRFQSKNPQKPSVHQPSAEPLQIESSLALEPEKNLYVIRCGEQQFLLASTPQGITQLAELEHQDRQDTLSAANVTRLYQDQSQTNP